MGGSSGGRALFYLLLETLFVVVGDPITLVICVGNTAFRVELSDTSAVQELADCRIGDLSTTQTKSYGGRVDAIKTRIVEPGRNTASKSHLLTRPSSTSGKKYLRVGLAVCR